MNINLISYLDKITSRFLKINFPKIYKLRMYISIMLYFTNYLG